MRCDGCKYWGRADESKEFGYCGRKVTQHVGWNGGLTNPDFGCVYFVDRTFFVVHHIHPDDNYKHWHIAHRGTESPSILCEDNAHQFAQWLNERWDAEGKC